MHVYLKIRIFNAALYYYMYLVAEHYSHVAYESIMPPRHESGRGFPLLLDFLPDLRPHPSIRWQPE